MHAKNFAERVERIERRLKLACILVLVLAALWFASGGLVAVLTLMALAGLAGYALRPTAAVAAVVAQMVAQHWPWLAHVAAAARAHEGVSPALPPAGEDLPRGPV